MAGRWTCYMKRHVDGELEQREMERQLPLVGNRCDLRPYPQPSCECITKYGPPPNTAPSAMVSPQVPPHWGLPAHLRVLFAN